MVVRRVPGLHLLPMPGPPMLISHRLPILRAWPGVVTALCLCALALSACGGAAAPGARVAGREIGHAKALTELARGKAALRWLPEVGVHYAFWSNEGIYEYEGLRGVSAWVLGAEDPAIWDVLARRMAAGRDAP